MTQCGDCPQILKYLYGTILLLSIIPAQPTIMRKISFVEKLTDNDPDYSRRKFLQHTGAGLLAATFIGDFAMSAGAQSRPTAPDKAPTIPADGKPVPLKPLDHPSEKKDQPVPTPDAPDKRIGYAIVGLGTLSLNQILPAFAQCRHSRVTALVSGNRNKAKKVALQYGVAEDNIYNYNSFDELRHNKEVDVIYIVLPNSMHAEFVIRGAKAGKHILCEKPMATSVADAEDMVSACRKAGVKLMIAYRIQYEPQHKQIKEWVRDEHWGKVRAIEAMNAQNIGDPTQWRLRKQLAGGGALPDIGLYCLNTIRYLTGEEPLWVSAHQYSTPGDERFKEVEETMMWQMQFPSGVMANCSTTYGVHESRRYRCYADRGGTFGMDPAFSYEGLQMEVSEVKDKGVEWKSHPAMPPKNQFASEMDHMSQCVKNDTMPFTPGEEGVQDQKIMEAIYRSAREGRLVKLTAMEGKDHFRGPEPKEEQG